MSSTGGSLPNSSLLLNDQQRSFDVSVEHEVIDLLKAVHQSPLDTEDKNELRDRIFAYKQNEGGPELAQLHESAQKLGFTILTGNTQAEESHVVPSKSSGMGATRPAPRFAVQQRELEPSRKTPPEESPVTLNPLPAPEPQAVPKETPKVEVPKTVVPEPVPDIQKPEEALPVQNAPDPLVRIQAIKRIVNEKVGNPVNLISAHQTVGREYMNALLDAMKKSNGGTGEEIATAMIRLERAFKAVENIDMGSSKMPAPQRTAEPQPKAAVSEPVSQTPIKVDADVVRPPEVKPQTAAPVTPVRPVAAQPAAHTEPTKMRESIAPMSSVRTRLQEETSVTPSPVQQQEPSAAALQDGMHSVAKEKQLQDLMRLDRLKEAQTKKAQVETQIGSMDPLLTPEVTSGLDQLLSEWALFKNSGIFGTGPSGKEHPLYKKISDLTMAAVIAGRFDGATAQVKQSITDYMNGWRYEEGIVHEHGETFEHYLRRVVRHILTKHSNR